MSVPVVVLARIKNPVGTCLVIHFAQIDVGVWVQSGQVWRPHETRPNLPKAKATIHYNL